jgi:hypothetical protein
MKFAEGWYQEIRQGDGERDDLLSYISDTHKSVYGYRPRGWETGSWSIEDLQAEAKRLEADVVQEIERAHSARAREAAQMAAHHLAVAAARKPAPTTYKPFANLKEMLV